MTNGHTDLTAQIEGLQIKARAEFRRFMTRRIAEALNIPPDLVQLTEENWVKLECIADEDEHRLLYGDPQAKQPRGIIDGSKECEEVARPTEAAQPTVYTAGPHRRTWHVRLDCPALRTRLKTWQRPASELEQAAPGWFRPCKRCVKRNGGGAT